VGEDFNRAILVLELRRYRSFDLMPGQPSCQHRQGVVQVEHGVNAVVEKVNRLHLQIPEVLFSKMFPEGIGAHDSHKKASIHAGFRGFAALVVGQIKAALDKRRPQSDPQAQGEWKKTPRNACRNPQRPGARQNHQADVSRRGALWAHL
jgi:hypothetical protein